MTYIEYLKTEHWQLLRQATFNRHGRKCVVCLDKGRIEVHHWRYQRTFFQTTIEDLVPLCEACHRMVHRHNNHGLTKAELIENYRERFMRTPVKGARKQREEELRLKWKEARSKLKRAK